MNIEEMPLIIPLITGIILSFLMILWLLIKKFITCYKIGAVLFFGFLIWMIFYSLELLGKELSFKILMSKIEYIGITIVPVTFFILVLYFSGYTNWTQIKKNFFLFIIPVITLGLVFTNEKHNLVWKELLLQQSGNYLFLDVEYGIGFWIYASFSYLLLGISYVILIKTIISKVRIFKIQAISMIIALSIAWSANILYVLKLLPWKHFDITPLTLVISSIILIYGFKFLKTGDIIPVRFEPKIDNEKDIAFTIDNKERLLSINSLGQKLLNISNKNIIGKPIIDIWPHYYKFSSKDYESFKEKEYAVFYKDSKEFIYDVHINLIVDNRKSLIYKTFILRDITDKINAEKALRQSEEKFRNIFENSLDGIYQSTLDGKYIDANNALVEMLGYKNREELISKDINKDIYYSEKDRPQFDEREKLFITRLKKKDGAIVWVEVSSRVVYEGNTPAYYEGVVRNIDERKKSEEEIKHLSYHDYLTDIYNMYFFEEELKRLDSERLYPISIVIIDINGFKLVNDAFGHKKGDEILKNTAKILKTCFRKEDIVARYGGDEFIIILPSTSKTVANGIVERVHSLFKFDSYKEFIMSLSIGITTKESKEQNINELIKIAEDNMYRHKLIEKQSSNNSIISSLEKALEERNYETHEHMDRMKVLALELGKKLQFSEDKLDELSLLSSLHDIGKIAISDNIILNPSKLTNEEFEIMKKHTEVGFRIANSNSELASIAKGILAHHERWDGKGYPMGLESESIPIIARAISIIDSYDAMINDRPYRKAHSKEYAIKELLKYAGSQFDPVLVEQFISMITSGKVLIK
ncbi:MAG: histidine kinase N-terminal 7TM domain-containing protein [Nitrososphaeraceae archaeon]